MKRPIVHTFLAVIMVISILFGTGCHAQTDSATHETHELTMAAESTLPDSVRQTPVRTQEAYRFAVANPDILKFIPCYCGCVQGGHRDNLECYVADFRPDGTVVYDNHAEACGICVDITQDTMDLLEQGRSLKEIRFYIDTTYAKYGPTTETPPVQ